MTTCLSLGFDMASAIMFVLPYYSCLVINHVRDLTLKHLELTVMFYVLTHCSAKGSQTPRIAARFHKTHKDWLPPKLDAIANYLSLE